MLAAVPTEAHLPALPGVRHRFVQAGGLRMHVAEAGEGDPVVMLHGWPQHWWCWRHLIPPLAERFRVLCPDLRGFGWSEAPPGGYGKETMTGDVLALADALGLGRFRLVGHDWGGFIGFLLCLRAPARVERYLALNTGQPFVQAGPSALIDLRRFWYQAVLAAPALGKAVVRDGRFVRAILRGGSVNRAAWSAEDEQIFLDRLAPPERARATVLLYRTFLLRELVPLLRGRYRSRRLATPTLILHGTGDPALRPEALRGLEAHADRFQLELVEGVGHFIAEEAPDLVRDRAVELFAD
jgi:pimeloyl-ACP methyl ester carboxylesterase